MRNEITRIKVRKGDMTTVSMQRSEREGVRGNRIMI
jgi:hypothetical protein